MIALAEADSPKKDGTGQTRKKRERARYHDCRNCRTLKEMLPVPAIGGVASITMPENEGRSSLQRAGQQRTGKPQAKATGHDAGQTPPHESPTGVCGGGPVRGAERIDPGPAISQTASSILKNPPD